MQTLLVFCLCFHFATLAFAKRDYSLTLESARIKRNVNTAPNTPDDPMIASITTEGTMTNSTADSNLKTNTSEENSKIATRWSEDITMASTTVSTITTEGYLTSSTTTEYPSMTTSSGYDIAHTSTTHSPTTTSTTEYSLTTSTSTDYSTMTTSTTDVKHTPSTTWYAYVMTTGTADDHTIIISTADDHTTVLPRTTEDEISSTSRAAYSVVTTSRNDDTMTTSTKYSYSTTAGNTDDLQTIAITTQVPTMSVTTAGDHTTLGSTTYGHRTAVGTTDSRTTMTSTTGDHTPITNINSETSSLSTQHLASTLCPPRTAGTACENCVDGWYRVAQLCVSCGCDIYGSKANVCDGTGQCECFPDGGPLPRKDCSREPYIYRVNPRFGPVAGGTVIQIYGGWLSAIVELWKWYQQCGNQRSSCNETYCEYVTPAQESVNASCYDELLMDRLNFTYRPNPNITAVIRTEVILSGGVDIPVVGSNLDSVAEPEIVITLKCRSSGYIIGSLDEKCVVVSSDLMNCKSPDFSSIIANARCPTKKFRRSPDYHSEFVFFVEFKLDGYDVYSNKSGQLEKVIEITIDNDPEVWHFKDEDKIHRLSSGETQLIVEGKDLKSGGVTEKDYTVVIGMKNFSVKALRDNVLTCEIPLALPPAADDINKLDPKTGETLPAVTVKCGTNIDVHIGYIARTQTDLTLAIAIPAALVLVLILGVICFLLWRSGKQGKIKIYRRGLRSKKMNSSARYVEEGKSGGLELNYIDPSLSADLKPLTVKYKNIELHKHVGQGQFGKVFLGSVKTKTGSTKEVAIKTIKVESVDSPAKAIKLFLEEAKLMKDFQHPNVLPLIGVSYGDDGLPMVLTPYMSRGDLRKVLKDQNLDLDLGDLLHFGMQIANGMHYLSSRKFIHRDLATRNCMVDDKFIVKVADFGLSHTIDTEVYYKVKDKNKPLPVKWMAIESLTEGKYSMESDIWSYGVVLWEIMTRGATPYPGVNNFDVEKQLKAGRRLSQPSMCPDPVYSIMLECWKVESSKRPKFSEISEKMAVFLNGDYEQHYTKNISGDYYSMPTDDTPLYENDFPKKGSDREPSNPEQLDNKAFGICKVEVSDDYLKPIGKSDIQESTTDDGYLKPDPST